MKVDIQTILNVCFAISITAFIYQNNSLKDDVETLKGYAQLDTDKAWERMDIMAEDITTHEDNIKTLYDNWKGQEIYNEEIKDFVNKNASQLKDVTNNQNKLIDAVATIQEWLEQNFGE